MPFLLRSRPSRPTTADRATKSIKRVVIYREELLPISQAFIKTQNLAYQSWRGNLVGVRRLDTGLNLDGIDVLQLRPNTRSLRDRIYRKLSNTIGQFPFYVHRRPKDTTLVHAHFGPDAVHA
jgi:glucosyltransferase